MVNTSGRAVENHEIERMIGPLAHRGPDGFGCYTDGDVGLGHVRLSIVNIAGGDQPMSIDGGRLWISFNGEIFNYLELREELIQKGHRFHTCSDTEVILHLYQEMGEDCVHVLNGQWAFAIWDAVRRRMFLSRDRMGVRPLFYTRTSEGFRFASEIKALFACPDVARELDLTGIEQIFTWWVTLPPRTAFRNISQLPPGHSLLLENATARLIEHWRLEYDPVSSEGSEQRLAEELFALLSDASRLRLRADVPVGAYLSGGLDSTFITALAGRHAGDRLRTFSVTFEDREFDERDYQQEASAFLNTAHTDVLCRYEDIASIFPRVVWHTEQPLLRTAPAPLFLLSECVRNSGFKVVLTGEGADELFGGYDIFKEAKIRRFVGRRPESTLRPLLLKRLYPYMPRIQKQSPAYLKRFFHASEEDLADPCFSHLPRWQLTASLKTFFSSAVRHELGIGERLQESPPAPAFFDTWDPFNRAEYLETQHLLPGYILSSQGDRMAMAHGVEGRYPFLDHRVVQFAVRLPPNLKMKVLNQKYLLKRAAAGVIPESIRRREKQPYRAPDAKSFVGVATDYVDDLLSPESIRHSGIFDSEAVTALVAKFKAGKPAGTRDNMALVGIISTELLRAQFVASARPSVSDTARLSRRMGATYGAKR